MLTTQNPFHAGEIEAQERAGVRNLAARVGGFIRDHMPDQHREFFSSLPFLVLAAADGQGRPWVTLLDGPDGFIASPDAHRLTLATGVGPHDPLAQTFADGGDIGLVGIELATRRRNRMSGTLRPLADGFEIDVRQSFGNCPQYINERNWRRAKPRPKDPKHASVLSAGQIEMIRAADTLFIGTGQEEASDRPANGYDASHRGGAAGFVEVHDNTHLRIPDYAGNNFFNTIGNLLRNPRVALLFVDFQTGSLLHLSGRATIDWSPQETREGGVHRYIDVTVEQVIERPGVLGLRWEVDGKAVRQLELVRKAREAQDITSFYFEPVDGRPLPDFDAGQHLPIELRLAPPHGTVKRSYSLSALANGTSYRLSIKRDPQGLVSRIMHDGLKPGDVIEARVPAGDFTLPTGNAPVVLVSAGVGITPMMAMLEQLAQDGATRTTWFIHGARNGAARAMGDAVRHLAHGQIQAKTFFSQPSKEDVIGRDFDQLGRISVQSLLELGAGPDAHYLLCGPADFVAGLQSGLEAAGVSPARIHFETF